MQLHRLWLALRSDIMQARSIVPAKVGEVPSMPIASMVVISFISEPLFARPLRLCGVYYMVILP